MNAAAARLLDLTNPDIAREWGYVRSDHYTKTQAIGTKALKAGYNVIRFSSERGMGANLAVLSDFGKILVPQMVVPAEEFDSAILTALSNELGGR